MKNPLSQLPSLTAKGLRVIAGKADRIDPGSMLRNAAVRVEALSTQSYSARLAELKSLEASIKNRVVNNNLVVANTPEPVIVLEDAAPEASVAN